MNRMMNDDFDNSSPDDTADGATVEKSPERRLLIWFLALVALSAASLLWLACRAESPSYLRSAMDFCMQAALGGLVAYLAFRTLFLYQFHLSDLLLMVLVLSLGMKITIEEAQRLAMLDIINERIGDPEHWGELLQICLVVGSVLLLGAAFGLRSCQARKLDKTLPRLLNILAGMLALPAAAGVAVFPVWLMHLAGMLKLPDTVVPVQLLPHVREHASPARFSLLILLYWFCSIFITAINSVNLIKNLTLTVEINAREKMP